MERREKPDIDTVREILQEQNERVSEEPAQAPQTEEEPEERNDEDDS